MRTMLVCRESPYPPMSGSPLRLWQQVNVLRSLGPVFVFSVGPAHAADLSTPMISEWIHVDWDAWPADGSGSFGGLSRLVRPPEFPRVANVANAPLNARLREFIARVEPDVIVLAHWLNEMPKALRGFPRVIIDSHNIESKLWSDTYAAGDIVAALRHWRFRRRETALSEAASATWVTSEDDRRLLARMSRRAKNVSVWPNAIDLTYYDPGAMTSAARTLGLRSAFPTLIFVGYMEYLPNHDAATMLISTILPRVRERYPEARLLIVGKNPRPELVELARRTPDVVVTGTVPDVRPYLSVSDLAVMPLNVGGGTRLKLLEAFATNVAVVSTSKGAEGIAVRGSREVAIADTPDEMVGEILRLLGDDAARSAQTNAAYRLVASTYSWQALSKRLTAEFEVLTGGWSSLEGSPG